MNLTVTLPDQSSYTMRVQYDKETRLYVGIIPDIPGAHTQGETLDELEANMVELLLLLEEVDDE